MNALIVGYGFVGKATEYLLQKLDWNIFIHDPALGYNFEDYDSIDYAFICVPTPSTGGRLDISILETVYSKLDNHVMPIVIRSTIGPDQVDMFPNAIIMPEFLRERHWKEDVDDPGLPIVIGLPRSGSTFPMAFKGLHKEVAITTSKLASMFKLSRNSALAVRVALANELHDICVEYDIDYDHLAKLLSNDISIGGTHWDVPGPDGKFGFGGNCLPKDLTHMSTLCYPWSDMLSNILEINKMRRLP
jgi:UDP-glucose 6-dehydrogenase